MDLLDFDGPEEEQQILARMDLMRQQPSFVGRYLEIIDEMRLAVVDFVAARTGLDPRRDLYPMLVAGACAASWDASLKLWVESGATLSLRALRREAFTALSAGLPSTGPHHDVHSGQHSARRQYLLVTTFRKDGRAVPTPVWGARDGDALVFWSVTDSGKMKRIRRDGHGPGRSVRRARSADRRRTCRAARSSSTRAGTEHVRSLLRRKYGVDGSADAVGQPDPPRPGRHARRPHHPRPASTPRRS